MKAKKELGGPLFFHFLFLVADNNWEYITNATEVAAEGVLVEEDLGEVEAFLLHPSPWGEVAADERRDCSSWEAEVVGYPADKADTCDTDRPEEVHKDCRRKQFAVAELAAGLVAAVVVAAEEGRQAQRPGSWL